MCNTTGSAITGVSATLTLRDRYVSSAATGPNPDADTLVRVVDGTSATTRTLSLGTLAAGACREAAFGVLLGETAGGPYNQPRRLFGRGRDYSFAVSGNGGAVTTSDTTGRLYIQKLVAQNRNAILRIDSDACVAGVCTVHPGSTYTFTIFAKSAPNGYDQTQVHLDLPYDIFDVVDVQTRWSAPARVKVNGVYGDGCGWDHIRTSGTWRSCVGPAGYTGGRVGGNVIRTTYTVKARDGLTGAETGGAISALIYDLSGKSYHYNGDFATSPARITAVNADSAADLSVSLSHSGAFVRDATGTYTLAVANAGPNVSGAITAAVQLPSGTGATFLSDSYPVSDATWTCTRDTDLKVTCARAPMASGAAAAAVTLPVAIAPGASASFDATANVSQGGGVGDPDPSDNTATDPTVTAAPAEADLVVINTVTQTALREETAQFSVQVRNDGPSSIATGEGELVTLTYRLPTDTSFSGLPAADGWTCEIAGDGNRTLTCTRAGPLAAPESVTTLPISVAIGAGAADPVVTEATVTAQGRPADPAPGNDVDVEASVSVARADLSIDKSSDGIFAITPAGSPAVRTDSFTVSVSNAGPDVADASPSRPIVVTDDLPANVDFLSASGSGWTCDDPAGGVLTCSRTTPLPAGTTAPPITVTFEIQEGTAEGIVFNRASVSGPTADPDGEDDESDDVALLVHETDAVIEVSAPATVSANTDVAYVVTVRNDGPRDATGMFWEFQLPPGATYKSLASTTAGVGDTACAVPTAGETDEVLVVCEVHPTGELSGTLDASADVTYTLTVSTVSDTTVSPLLASAEVFLDQVDPDLLDNVATVTTECSGGCVLAPVVAITAGEESVDEHESALRTYTYSASHTSLTSSMISVSCGGAGTLAAATIGAPAGGVSTGSFDCRFRDGFFTAGISSTSAVSVTATITATNARTATRPVTIHNVAPTAAVDVAAQVDAGTQYPLRLTGATDVSDVDRPPANALEYRFDCGAGYGDWSATASTSCTAPGQPGAVTVRGQVRDKDAGVSTYHTDVDVLLSEAHVAFTTPARTVEAGTCTSVITVQLRDADGLAAPAAGAVTLYLFSSSGTGEFLAADGGDLAVAGQLSVPEGQSEASFCYRDSSPGEPTITVADVAALGTPDADYVRATQTVTVLGGVAVTLTGSTADLLIDGQRTLTARVVDADGAVVTTGPDASRVVTFSQSSGEGTVTGLGQVTAGEGVATVTVTGATSGPVSISAGATLAAGARTAGPVTFTVRAPGAQVSPDPLTFAALPPGTPSETETITVTNSGDAALTISAWEFAGANPADFAVVSQTCTSGPLAPDATCTFTVRFTPGAAGPRAATLNLTTNAGTVTSALAGTGSAPGDANRAPTIGIAVTPDPPRTDDVVTATVTASDLDGDPLSMSYVWRVNGVTMRTTTTSLTTDTYDLGVVARGDVANYVTVTVTASDGALSASATETVRVANSAPTAVSRTASIRAGVAGGSVSLAGTDPDDQTLHYVVTSLPTKGVLKVQDRTIVLHDLPFTLQHTVAGVTVFPSQVTYVPNAPYLAREDSFTYTVRDTDPTNPLPSTNTATMTVGVHADGQHANATTGATTVVGSGAPTTSRPMTASVDARAAGLQITIAGAPPTDDVPDDEPDYRFLDLVQELHIENTDGNGDPTGPATADANDPFRIEFTLLPSVLPEGASATTLRVYREGAFVPDCEDDLARPALDQPCVDGRSQTDSLATISVLTLNASLWSFAGPASAPDTAILAGYQGATSAGAPNDPGAPNAPTAGTLEGFAFSSNQSGATFECRLTRFAAGANAVVQDWTACTSGSKTYDIAGVPDDLFIFEVRAVNGGTPDATPARRDFVVDRTAVSITITSGPTTPHPGTDATFAFTSNKAGTDFECLLRLQGVVAGTYTSCTSPHLRTGLVAGSAYEFVVRGTDPALNTGTATRLFTVAGGGGADPVPEAPDDEDDEPDEDEEGPTSPPRGRVVRVAGAGRAETAAALAMRYFEPGVEAVYIARDDDFPDALTATPLATRHGAPILLVSHEGIPASTATALRFLEPGRIVVLGGPAAVTVEVERALGAFAVTVQRLRGVDRFGTAAEISRSLYPEGAGTVLLATGANFADALSAGAAGAVSGAPVLLVGQSHLPVQTAEELRRLRVTNVIALGGRAAIAPAVLAEVERLLGLTVERIAGGDRYATAAAVSARFFPDAPPAAFIATGQDFADALTVGPVSGKLGSPLLLVHPEELPPSIAAELTRMQPRQIVLVGGPKAVSEATEAAIRTTQGA